MFTELWTTTSPLTSIIFLLTFYSLTLLFFTVYSTYMTSWGMFYILIFILSLLLALLLYNFNNVLLYNMTWHWEHLIVYSHNLFPEFGLSFYFDSLSYLFTLLVCLIGLATNMYMLNYLKYEANEDSFMLLLNWFVLGMIFLVTANNLFTLFLGWELIGLTSFFLINFWHHSSGTLKSSFKAFVFNKISDFFLFIFITLMWVLTGKTDLLSLNIETFYLTHTTNSLWYIAGMSLILCSSMKSAQMMGHLWLPDSMEAPVPASALMHSATLVSAGLYLLLSFNIFLTFLDLNYIIIIIGSLTAAYGGVVAAAQTDMKKLLAYSTISHCGFLFVCAGLQNYFLVMIYLFLHGLFKALTFFCVGSFIRVAGSQDTSKMGMLSSYMPVDTLYLIMCSSNLGGLPFTLGYFYKQFFLATLLSSNYHFFVVGFCFMGMLSSIVYVYSLVYFSAFDINKGDMNYTLKTLQDNKSLDKNMWSASTLIQTFAIMLLLFLTIMVYILLYNYAIFNHLTLEHFPMQLESDMELMKSTEVLYQFYINFYYVLYVLIMSIIVIMECRSTYTWLQKMHFLLFLIFFLLSLSVVFLFF